MWIEDLFSSIHISFLFSDLQLLKIYDATSMENSFHLYIIYSDELKSGLRKEIKKCQRFKNIT